jgi:hypothetical protein
VGPLATLVGRSRCPAVAPNAVSGFSLVADQPPGDYVTGQLQVSDFFPIVRGRRRPVARQWAVGVRNLTDQPQRWIWGSMCLGADRGAARPSAARAAQPRLGGIRRQAQAGRRARLKELCKKPLWARTHRPLCRRLGY